MTPDDARRYGISARIYVVTGTDTGVGKTVVTAALAATARAAGQRVAVLKPAQTGCPPVGADSDDPPDTAEVTRLAGRVTERELVRYREPLAPATAARRLGEDGVAAARVVAEARRLASGHDLVLVEGAGGLLVRLNTQGETIAEVADALAAEVLVVTRCELGTLNATELTVEAARRRGLRIRGLVIGSWPENPDVAQRCNRQELPEITGVPLLGVLPAGAARLGREGFRDVAAALNVAADHRPRPPADAVPRPHADRPGPC
ncbi:dethiobiotin synthase [Lipingzhangella sp. LS1_29]|uniref:ATP-dependent dethiobiotin synthetase BioD n=1 Tax=Lipingzhangella rawalii TaxID=2055835 RepID=A0ABU2H6R1_9ACTN|nr:dethiobiotin synthase [Lipingzhangella rawalii]MDS1270991.1 dethiobiotin synthase [Lipingzhangella rawalii]